MGEVLMMPFRIADYPQLWCWNWEL